MKNYVRFTTNWRAFQKGMKMGMTTGHITDEARWDAHITSFVENAKIFRIDENIKMMLARTIPPNKNDNINLPFNHMFLDVNFSAKELQDYGIETKELKEIVGLGVSKGTLCLDRYEDDTKCIKDNVGKCIRIAACIRYGEEIRFETFSTNLSFTDERLKRKPIKHIKSKVIPHNIMKFLHHYTINLINLLNNPDIKVIEIDKDVIQNKKRMNRGKVPIPAQSIIRITGTLRTYMNRIRSDPRWNYNYRFWVMGHFRTLRSEKWGDKQGTRTWILPYIKGKGMLIEKEYIVK